MTAAAVLAGYAALSVLLTWPLWSNLCTHLLGSPTGDTGVYVWNIWVFRHELIDHHRLPFSTDHLFAYTGAADFAVHNYTPLAGLAGTFLIPWVGVVGAYNVVMLAFLIASAACVYLLSRQLALRPAFSFAAGAVFMASPLLTARETAHLSLIAAAPLPLFLCMLLRVLDRPRRRDAIAIGLIVALAVYADAYYGIYCVMMGGFVLGWRFLGVETRCSAWPRGARWIDGGIVIVGLLIAWRVVTGATTLHLGPLRADIATLYTPQLALVVLVGARLYLTWRPVVRVHDPDGQLPRLVRQGLLAVAVSVALLAPFVVGYAWRLLHGRLPQTATLWRSSPRGVDLLAYIVPNPSHVWFGRWTHGWFLPDAGDAFPEYVSSFPLVALLLVAVAAAWRSLPRVWVAFTGCFVLLSLGPFVHVGGVNTFAIGPWALLRYVPVLGMARAPSRFAVIAILGLSLLVAFALQAWQARPGRGWRIAAGVLAFLLAFELFPAPRVLYSAAVPDVYRLIAAQQGDQGRLLELPAGIRDGTSSLGDFSASSQFFQTRHGRPLIGGYLSRVSEWRKRENRRMPVLAALYALSSGHRSVPDDLRIAAIRSRDRFLARSCIKYVIADKLRASPELRAFAVDVLGLTLLHQDAQYELFTPMNPPACSPPGAHGR